MQRPCEDGEDSILSLMLDPVPCQGGAHDCGEDTELEQGGHKIESPSTGAARQV